MLSRAVSAFVLAGGVSSRMRSAKGLLELKGLPLIVRTAMLAESLVSRVIVVGEPETYAPLGLQTIPDQLFGVAPEACRSKGPLFGIATALAASDTPWNLILACDLPYLTREWLEWLLVRAARSNAQAVVPNTTRGLEPLAAAYRRECLPAIERSLAQGVRKVTDALNDLAVERVDQREWGALDPDGMVLKNMNTPADYEEARAWWNARTDL